MKIDLHVHTSEVSACGKLPAVEMVRLYKEAGYDAICITNHFTLSTATSHAKKGRFDFVQWYDYGYRLAKEEGDRIGLKVFKGYEMRCNQYDNDFLVYHLPDNLLENATALLSLPQREFLKVLRDNGVKIFQAHPFRNSITVTDPALIDGIEEYNGSNGPGDKNDMAQIWAKHYSHLIPISGSDAHSAPAVGKGGIETDEEVNDVFDLLSVLERRNYTLIKN